MSTKAKLNKLLKTKEDIKKAIQNKGGNVGDVFDEYPAAISNLDAGKISIKETGIKFGESDWEEIPDRFDFSGLEDWSELFYENFKLNKIDLNFNATPTSMHSTFHSCISLNKIDLSKWDLSKNTNLYATFDSCTNLQELNLGKAETQNVQNFHRAFANCKELVSLQELDASGNNYDTPSYFDSPFYGAESLRHFGGFKNLSKTMNVEQAPLTYQSVLNILNGLAEGVTNKTIYFNQTNVNMLSDEDIAIATNKGWTVSPAKTINEPIVVTSLNQIPSNTVQIVPQIYDFSQFTGKWSNPNLNYKIRYVDMDISSSTDLEYMLSNLSNLRELNLTGTENVRNISRMMPSHYPELDISHWTVPELRCNWVFQNYERSNVKLPKNIKLLGSDGLFYMNETVTSIDATGWDMSENTTMYQMFEGAENLEEIIGIEDWDVSKVAFMGHLFEGCKSLKRLDLSKWNTSSVEGNVPSFQNCENLEELNIRGLDFRGCGYLHYTFRNCKKLKHIDLTGVKFDTALIASYVFAGCENLLSVTITEPIGFNEFHINFNTFFEGVTTNGTFYYNPANDYTKIINALPSTWKAVPITE